MIARSDLVILTVSTAALAVGIFRWQHATTVVPSVTVPASARQAAPVPAASAPEVTTLPARADAAGPELQEDLPAPVVSRLPPADAAAPASVDAPAPVEVPATPSVAAIEAAPAAPEYGVYRVRSGDYLGRIAERHGTTVRALRELNGIRGSTIQVGQRIRYPLPAN